MADNKIIFFEDNAGSQYDELWDRFADNHPHGNIFQSSYYYRLFTGSKKFRPVVFLIIEGENRIKGVLSGIIQYHLPGPLRDLSGRCIVTGGPIVENDDPDLVTSILSEFDRYMKKNVLYSQFRNMYELNGIRAVFERSSYIYEDHLNIVVNLSQSEEILFNNIHSTKRYEIRKASKAGLTLKIIDSPEEFRKSYNILDSLYSRIKLPLFPFDVFLKAFEHTTSGGKAIFFGAYLNDELLGTMYTLCYRGSMFNFFAGSYPDYNKYFPNSFIPWKVFLWGKLNNMSQFNWGGAGNPQVPYSVRDYKEKFGGDLVNFGRYEKIYKPLLFTIARIGFRIWQVVKGLKQITL